MHRLIVRKFGPIDECEIEIKNFMVLIGPQSSGKSTISKLVFFFLDIREEIIQFLLNEAEKKKNKITFLDFVKHIRKRFVEFWGPIPQNKELYIKYEYSSSTWIEIGLDHSQHRYITPKFSQNVFKILTQAYPEIRAIYDKTSQSLFDSSTVISFQRKREETISKLKSQLNSLFDFDKELLFIPAGRSLLSTLSDQLQYIHPYLLDYPMRQFIERINATKLFFNKSIDEIITERQALGSSAIWFSSVRRTQAIIKRILKGEYIHDRDGGKVYVGPGVYTKINYASSGQQESVWILLSLFLIVLDKVNAFVFVEEPEAHLFPDTQKDLVELMSFLTNSLNSSFLITTHSPYILSAVNNHIYAHSVGQKHSSEVDKIINSSQWISPKIVGGFYVNGGCLEDLFDAELNMLKTELIDSASNRINNEYDKLFNIEQEGHPDAQTAR